ncbi:hypothetical protein F5Y08DRAFT_350563 [Xylaria arbuscula]|nr:hypothetical protein F5Y08DRAFT_350563 [Xylaria arbuscula]
MGLLPLTYRRPDYVSETTFKRNESTVQLDEKADASVRSGRSGAPAGIPDALTFDKIINGGTCPPCTVRDFMNYLIYIEHAAENLQFFLWYRDYVKRFAAAPASETALSPEWTAAKEEEALARIQRDAADKARKGPAAAMQIFKGTDFEKTSEHFVAVVSDNNRNPFATPPRSSAGDNASLSGSQATTYVSQASDAFYAAGVKQPFTIQPFRDEINRVVMTYLVDDAPRQLNLSSRQQKAVIRALTYTTHPSAVGAVIRSIEDSLRRQAHPNFIRWVICNGNPARVAFARGLGVSTILLAVLWVVGIATLVMAAKGMCVVLHGLHHRHVRPWELFVDDSATDIDDLCSGGGKQSFDSFGSGNSYEDEPWVVQYRRRFVVRKIFDREVWIQEPALRQIQDTIFLQSMLMASFGAAVLTVIFVAVPAGNFF